MAQVNNQQIKIFFSNPMDQESVAKAFSISPDVDGNISWVNNILHFTPVDPLSLDTKYSIQLTESARDVYGKNIKPHQFAFTTVKPTVVYIGNDDQLYVSDLDKNTKALITNGKVEEFAVAPNTNTVVYIDKTSQKYTSRVYVINISTMKVAELFQNIKADFSNPVLTPDGSVLYVLARGEDKNGSYSEKRVYEYNFKSEIVTNHTEVINDHPSLKSFWLTPDGNTMLINDSGGNYFLRPIHNKTNTLIGKFNDYGGVTMDGEELLFTLTDAESSWMPYLIAYNGETRKINVERDAVVFPRISSDGRFFVYSYFEGDEINELKDQRTGVRIIDAKSEEIILSLLDDKKSYERGSLSPDNRIVAIEAYKREGHFMYISSKPLVYEDSTIEFIDVATGKLLPVQLEGRSVMWLE